MFSEAARDQSLQASLPPFGYDRAEINKSDPSVLFQLDQSLLLVRLLVRPTVHPLDLLFRALSFSPFLFFYPFRSCVPAGYLPVIPLLCLVALTIEHSISPISQPTNEQMKLLPFSSNRSLLNLNSCKRRDKNRSLKKQAAHQLTLLCKVSG